MESFRFVKSFSCPVFDNFDAFRLADSRLLLDVMGHG
jgi:hypothetical protein